MIAGQTIIANVFSLLNTRSNEYQSYIYRNVSYNFSLEWFSNNYKKLMIKYIFQDSYFYYLGFKVFVSVLTPEFFDNITNWQSIRAICITFHLLPRALPFDQQYYSEIRVGDINCMYLLPFNFYSDGIVYSSNAGFTKTIAPDSFQTVSQVFCIQKYPIVFIRENEPYSGYSDPNVLTFDVIDPGLYKLNNYFGNQIIFYFESLIDEPFTIRVEYPENSLISSDKYQRTIFDPFAKFYLMNLTWPIKSTQLNIEIRYEKNNELLKIRLIGCYSATRPIIGNINRELISHSTNFTPNAYLEGARIIFFKEVNLFYDESFSKFISRNSERFRYMVDNEPARLYYAIPYDNGEVLHNYTINTTNTCYLNWNYEDYEGYLIYPNSTAIKQFLEQTITGTYNILYIETSPNQWRIDKCKGWFIKNYTEFDGDVSFTILPINSSLEHICMNNGFDYNNVEDAIATIQDHNSNIYPGVDTAFVSPMINKEVAIYEKPMIDSVLSTSTYDNVTLSLSSTNPPPDEKRRIEVSELIFKEIAYGPLYAGIESMNQTASMEDQPFEKGVRIPKQYFNYSDYLRFHHNRYMTIKKQIFLSNTLISQILGGDGIISIPLINAFVTDYRFISINEVATTFTLNPVSNVFSVYYENTLDSQHSDDIYHLIFTNFSNQSGNVIYKIQDYNNLKLKIITYGGTFSNLIINFF